MGPHSAIFTASTALKTVFVSDFCTPAPTAPSWAITQTAWQGQPRARCARLARRRKWGARKQRMNAADVFAKNQNGTAGQIWQRTGFPGHQLCAMTPANRPALLERPWRQKRPCSRSTPPTAEVRPHHRQHRRLGRSKRVARFRSKPSTLPPASMAGNAAQHTSSIFFTRALSLSGHLRRSLRRAALGATPL